MKSMFVARTSVWAVFATSVIVSVGCLASAADLADGGLSCGVYSVAILHKLERGTNDLDRISARLVGHQAHSMAEIRDASNDLGLTLQGIALEQRDWPLDRPAIGFLNHGKTGQFAVIRAVGPPRPGHRYHSGS